jgi:hypothetical protein
LFAADQSRSPETIDQTGRAARAPCVLQGRSLLVKRVRSLLRLAAVASSVLLVGGCISYRSGALDWLRDDPAGSDLVEAAADGDRPAAADGAPPTPKPGRKAASTNEPPQGRPLFMLWAKSDSRPTGTQDAVDERRAFDWLFPPVPPEQPPVVMPGTKSSFFSTFPKYGKAKAVPLVEAPSESK